MPQQVPAVPPSVFRLAPPYQVFEAVPDPAELAPEVLPDASVLAVHLPAPQETWSEAARLVPRLRARFPAAPVVLRVGRGGDQAADWARRAGGIHVRAVLLDDEPPFPRLRRVLTDATDLPDQIERWLPVRLPGLPPAVAHLIGGIVRGAPGCAEVGELLAGLGHAERTARTWFRRAGVPGPGKWLAAAHAVRAALRLQAEEGAPLLALAVECGYSDHSSLSRQSLRLFGLRPGAIRGTLGWEWLLDRWLRRASVPGRVEGESSSHPERSEGGMAVGMPHSLRSG
jgi:AraC-like DNA-binding protein